MSKTQDENIGDKESKENIPELRYVPLEYLQSIQQEEEEIDFVRIIKKIWDGRYIIIKTVGIFIIIGLAVALLSKEVYTSEVSLMPETEETLPSLGGLSGLASSFGFGSVNSLESGGIPASLYPRIGNSSVFLIQLLEYEVMQPDSSGNIKLIDYIKEHSSASIFVLTKRFIRDLYRDDQNTLSELDNRMGDEEKIGRLVSMSQQDWEILRNFREQVTINQDTETGLITVQVRFQEPLIAADLADQVVIFLSEYITEYRTEKARRDVEFIKERYNEAEQRFIEAQEELARFNDQNRGQLTAMARTQEQVLQSRYNLTFNLYNSLAERLEEARITLQEETPVLKVLDPAAIPDMRTSPKRTFLMVIFTMLGGIAGIALVLFLPYAKELKARLNDETD